MAVFDEKWEKSQAAVAEQKLEKARGRVATMLAKKETKAKAQTAFREGMRWDPRYNRWVKGYK